MTPSATRFRPPSLGEIHSSVDTSHVRGWRKALAFAGPAYLVSVGYMDPGNWATDLEGGAGFGYKLLWVLVMSNLMAIFLQALSARLGVVSGRDLAQVCRAAYPRAVSIALWGLSEIAVAACDLAEVLGAGIGLNLLLHIPLWAGILVTAGDTLVLLWLQQFRIRSLEMTVVRLIVIIAACLGMELFLARPDTTGVLAGLTPSLNKESLFATIAILGATVMPHNLYLHSALVQSRKVGKDHESKRQACRHNLFDTLIALNAAMLINIAILVLAASVFFKHGVHVVEFQRATDLLAPLVGANAARTIFALALICAGQASTITGTMAGQVVMEGFLNLRMRAWVRRLITRSLAIIPAAGTVYLAGSKGAYELLVLTQAVLAMQLPFALIPLIRFTGSRHWMGEFASRTSVQCVAWLVAAVNLVLNLWLAQDKLLEWLKFEGFYGSALGIATVVGVPALVILLGYVLIAPIDRANALSRPAEAAEKPEQGILFIDRVTPAEPAIGQIDALARQLNGIMFVKDADGRYVHLGADSASRLGLDPANVLSKSDEELWDANVARACRESDRIVLTQLRKYVGIETAPRDGALHSWFLLKFPVIERASQAVFLCCIGIDVTERARSEEELRRFARHLQIARDEERAATSRDVHDIGQLLTALDFHLAAVGESLRQGEDPASLTASLGAASDLLATTISTSARISGELRPSSPEHLGLAGAIHWHARETAARGAFRVVFDRVDEVAADPHLTDLIFRVFRAILASLAAQPRIEIRISLRAAGPGCHLEVRARADEGLADEIRRLSAPEWIEAREIKLLYGGAVTVSHSTDETVVISVAASCGDRLIPS